MQYILTEEEYKSLLEKKEVSYRISEKKLQLLCTHIANTMPLSETWGKKSDTPVPWTCILNNENYDWYCDECPVKMICPCNNKRFSQ